MDTAQVELEERKGLVAVVEEPVEKNTDATKFAQARARAFRQNAQLLSRNKRVESHKGLGKQSRFQGIRTFFSSGQGDSVGLWTIFKTMLPFTYRAFVAFLLASVFMLSFGVGGYLAPAWIMLTVRVLFSDSAGSIDFKDYASWLTLYVLVLAVLWGLSVLTLGLVKNHAADRIRRRVTGLCAEHRRLIKLNEATHLIDQCTEDASEIIVKTVPMALLWIISTIAAVVKVFTISWKLGLCSLGIVAGDALLGLFYDHWTSNHTAKLRDLMARDAELWSALETADEDEKKSIHEQIPKNAREQRRLKRHESWMGAVMVTLQRLLMFMSPVAMVLLGGYEVKLKDLRQYQLIEAALFLGYGLLCMILFNKEIVAAITRLPTAETLTIMLMGTKDIQSQNPSNQDKNAAPTIRRFDHITGGPKQKPRCHGKKLDIVYITIGLLLMGGAIATIVWLALTDPDSHKLIECRPQPVECRRADSDHGIYLRADPLILTIPQVFTMEGGCEFTKTYAEIMDTCVEKLIEDGQWNCGFMPGLVDCGKVSWTVEIQHKSWDGKSQGFRTLYKPDTTNTQVGGGSRRLMQPPAPAPQYPALPEDSSVYSGSGGGQTDLNYYCTNIRKILAAGYWMQYPLQGYPNKGSSRPKMQEYLNCVSEWMYRTAGTSGYGDNNGAWQTACDGQSNELYTCPAFTGIGSTQFSYNLIKVVGKDTNVHCNAQRLVGSPDYAKACLTSTNNLGIKSSSGTCVPA